MGAGPFLPDDLVAAYIGRPDVAGLADLRALCLTHPRFAPLIRTHNIRFIVATPLCVMSARYADGAACYQLMLACGTGTIGRNIYQVVRMLLNLRTADGARTVAVCMLP